MSSKRNLLSFSQKLPLGKKKPPGHFLRLSFHKCIFKNIYYFKNFQPERIGLIVGIYDVNDTIFSWRKW
jgi:hypothetical protein